MSVLLRVESLVKTFELEQRTIEVLRGTLERHGVEHQLEIYPGTEHGFCFPERTWCYVEPAAEDVWRRTFEMFQRQLG